MTDIQAKYNALLRKFIGDSTLVIDGDTENELAKDIAAAMKEKAKRNAEAAKLNMEVKAMVNLAEKTDYQKQKESEKWMAEFRAAMKEGANKPWIDFDGVTHYPPPQY